MDRMTRVVAIAMVSIAVLLVFASPALAATNPTGERGGWEDPGCAVMHPKGLANGWDVGCKLLNPKGNISGWVVDP